MGIALCCVLAAYATTELLEVAAPNKELSQVPYETTVEPPQVAASAAEPSEMSVVLDCELPPCAVMAKEAICELSPYPVTVKEDVCELSLCSVTAKEVVCEISPCPVTAKEAVCELSPCPVMVMETVSELLLCSGPADGPISEILSCYESALEADCDLSVWLYANFELFVLPISVNLSNHELSVCPGSTYESVF